MTSKPWIWISIGVAVITGGAVAQVVSESAANDRSSQRSSTVRVEYRATGNAMHATVSWRAPEGIRTYTGELPLMNTTGTRGVSYDLPVGTPVSITVTNLGSQGSTNLGFAGNIGCLIEVDGVSVSDDSARGFNESVTCSATAAYTLGSK